MTSKSFLPESIIEKLSHEKFNLHVSHDDKWLDTAEGEGEVPCSFTLVARCRIVLPINKNNIYIGKTIRHLATRVKEHGFSPSPSAVSNHLSSCETCKLNFSCDSFLIIDSGKNDFEVTIKEALHIKFKKPTINRQLYSQGSSFVLNVF